MVEKSELIVHIGHRSVDESGDVAFIQEALSPINQPFLAIMPALTVSLNSRARLSSRLQR